MWAIAEGRKLAAGIDKYLHAGKSAKAGRSKSLPASFSLRARRVPEYIFRSELRVMDRLKVVAATATIIGIIFAFFEK